MVHARRHGELLRLDPTTGEITWQTDLFGAISAFGYRFSSLYVGTRGGEMYAFHDSVDGVDRPTELWQRRIRSAVETILPDENCVLIDTFGGPLQCLQTGAHAGTTRWSIDTKWATAAPVSTAYTLFTAGYDGVTAVRDSDKEVNWRYRGRYDATGPVAAGDTLYVSSGDAVHAVALDGGVGAAGVRLGAKRWSHPTPARTVEGRRWGGVCCLRGQRRRRDDAVLSRTGLTRQGALGIRGDGLRCISSDEQPLQVLLNCESRPRYSVGRSVWCFGRKRITVDDERGPVDLTVVLDELAWSARSPQSAAPCAVSPGGNKL